MADLILTLVHAGNYPAEYDVQYDYRLRPLSEKGTVLWDKLPSVTAEVYVGASTDWTQEGPPFTPVPVALVVLGPALYAAKELPRQVVLPRGGYLPGLFGNEEEVKRAAADYVRAFLHREIEAVEREGSSYESPYFSAELQRAMKATAADAREARREEARRKKVEAATQGAR